MRRLLLPILVAAIVPGCEPAPSTKLAPDQPPPDTSKMTQKDWDDMLKQNSSKNNPPARNAPREQTP